MSRLLRSAAFALLLALPTLTSAQSLGPPLTTWEPNGAVKALALDGHTLYAGGDFDIVGPVTGSFGTVDASDATAFTTGAAVLENTAVIAADGAGGWFVATDTFFGPANSVLHVLPDGTRDPAWTSPVFDQGLLQALVFAGGRVFVGGDFRTVNGISRPGLAALDPASGALLPWDPRLIGVPNPPGFTFPPAVFRLAEAAGRLYVSGLFTEAGGAARVRFAVLDVATSNALPGVLPSPTGTVVSLAATATRVYVVGDCGPAGIVLCAYGADMTPLAGWTFPVAVGTIAVGPTALFTLGSSSVGPPYGITIVARDLDSGSVLPFTPPVLLGAAGTFVNALTVAGNTVYAAGSFATVNGQRRTRIAALNATTGTLLPWAPLVGGEVRALAVAGSRVAFGGTFRISGGVAKRNLVALDMRSGRPGPATPDLPFTVQTLLPLGGVMVVGGERPFGVSGPDLTAFTASTGALLPWGLESNGAIATLASDGRRLFIGGRFSSLSGALRLNVAAVDLATASLTSWNPQPNEAVRTLAVDGQTLFAGGSFTALAGYGRNRLAAYDAPSGAVLSFEPVPSPGVFFNGFVFAPGRVLAAGDDFTQPYGASPLTWLDRVSGAPVASIGVTFRSSAVARFDGTSFLAGNVGDGTSTLLAIDSLRGRTRSWPLPVDSIQGVRGALAVNADYVAVSSGAGVLSSGRPFAVFTAPRAGAPQQMQSTVTGNTVTLGWTPGTGPATTAYLVEAGTTAGSTNVGVFNVGLSTRVAGALAPGTYYIRVRGVGANGAGAASSEVIATVPPTSTAPSTPGTLSASVSAGVVTLSWGAAAGNAASYVIEAGTAAGLTNIGALPTGNLDTTWSVPAPAGTYFVRVRAANAFGLSAATNEVTVVVP